MCGIAVLGPRAVVAAYALAGAHVRVAEDAAQAAEAYASLPDDVAVVLVAAAARAGLPDSPPPLVVELPS